MTDKNHLWPTVERRYASESAGSGSRGIVFGQLSGIRTEGSAQRMALAMTR
jgi:hypothetical protein